MYGVQSLKAASFLVLSNVLYYTWYTCSSTPDISEVYKNDKIIQAILNKENLSMGQMVSSANKYLNVTDLIEKYSMYVNLYLQKLQSEHQDNFECTTWTTRLIVLCLASLACMVLFMKCKKPGIKSKLIEKIAPKLSNMYVKESSCEKSGESDEEWILTDEIERHERSKEQQDDLNFGNLCLDDRNQHQIESRLCTNESEDEEESQGDDIIHPSHSNICRRIRYSNFPTFNSEDEENVENHSQFCDRRLRFQFKRETQ